METPVLDDILTRLRKALEDDNLNEAAEIIEALRPSDQADLFSELEDDHQLALLPQLDPTDSADILERMNDAEAADLVADLSTETLIRIVDEMEPDEAADLLGDIHPDQAQAVLDGLEQESAEDIRPLMLHADDSAGGLMTSEFLALRHRMTPKEALEAIRVWGPEGEKIYHLYIVDQHARLVGVVSLQRLVLAPPKAILADIMETEVVSVTVGVDQEECARVMQHYDLVSLPVVNENRALVGVVTIDDVIDVLIDEATEDMQRFGGAQPLKRSYLENPVFSVMRTRIMWLMLLFVTGSLTGTVMQWYDGHLEAVVALSFFIPLLIGTGGNAGTQTTSTIIRALGVGDIDLSDAWHTCWHELRVGLLLGTGMAVVAYIRAITWDTSPELALTVSIAILSIVVWANTLGALLPLLATRLKVDPTVVSGPVMSTLVDATGLLIYFNIAGLIMGI